MQRLRLFTLAKFCLILCGLPNAWARYHCATPLNFTQVVAVDKSPAIIVIDPFSHRAGADLEGYANELGIKVIFVQSQPWPRFQALSQGKDFIEYRGNLDEVIHNIQARAARDNLHIVGALPGLEGPAVMLFDAITEHMKLPSNGTHRSRPKIFKPDMAALLRAHKVRVAANLTVGANDEGLLEGLAWFRNERKNFKSGMVVLKPVASAGTDKVFQCSSEGDIRAAFQEIQSQPDTFGRTNHQIYFQEFIKTRPFDPTGASVSGEYIFDSVSASREDEGVVMDTLHVPTSIWLYERSIPPDHLRVPIIKNVHWVPYDKIPKGKIVGGKEVGMVDFAKLVLNIFHIFYGPVHLELFIDEDGEFVVGEIGARMPGASVRISSAGTGHKLNQAVMSIESTTQPERIFQNYTEYAQNGYPTLKHVRVVHLNISERGLHPDLAALANLEKDFKCIEEVKIYPTTDAELPLTIDLQSLFVKVHFEANSFQELEDCEKELRRAHSTGRFYRK